MEKKITCALRFSRTELRGTMYHSHPSTRPSDTLAVSQSHTHAKPEPAMCSGIYDKNISDQAEAAQLHQHRSGTKTSAPKRDSHLRDQRADSLCNHWRIPAPVKAAIIYRSHATCSLRQTSCKTQPRPHPSCGGRCARHGIPPGMVSHPAWYPIHSEGNARTHGCESEATHATADRRTLYIAHCLL